MQSQESVGPTRTRFINVRAELFIFTLIYDKETKESWLFEHQFMTIKEAIKISMHAITLKFASLLAQFFFENCRTFHSGVRLNIALLKCHLKYQKLCHVLSCMYAVCHVLNSMVLFANIF